MLPLYLGFYLYLLMSLNSLLMNKIMLSIIVKFNVQFVVEKLGKNSKFLLNISKIMPHRPHALCMVPAALICPFESST